MLRRIKIIPLFMIDQDDSFGYLWISRWGAGEDSGGRKKAYLTWQKKNRDRLNVLGRETYKLASAEDSDVPSPKWKAVTISMNLPSRLSRLPSQAELEGEQAFFSLF